MRERKYKEFQDLINWADANSKENLTEIQLKNRKVTIEGHAGKLGTSLNRE